MVRPTVILPGYLAGAAPYAKMAQTLEALGYPTRTVPLSRWDWLPTVGGRSMFPILQKLDATVQALLQDTGADQVNLVGHSAGGWIARIYMGETPYNVHRQDHQRRQLWAAHPQVASLITLGTPHVSEERWTRRNLDFVNHNYPGAFEADVHYVCIAGKAIYGERSWTGWFTYNSYLITGGEGACWGDGITPITAAHLERAKNLVLDQVYHSPRPGYRWYGSPEVVHQWAQHLT